MYKRSIELMLDEALEISPVVLVSGARQVGKSTLCMNRFNAYSVFDNLSTREAALHDPIGFVQGLPKPIVLDEIQKVPQILEAIKMAIDKERINGTFLLTGSANLLDMKQTKDTLAGRIIELPMWPLSQKELHDKPHENIVDFLFSSPLHALKLPTITNEKLFGAVLNGGYPEIQKITSPRGKMMWFNSYISTYVERDIRDVGELRDLSAFIRFFNIIAPRSTGIVNKSDLANDANLSEFTLSNYLSMLEMIYQISLLKPFSSNISKRFIKSPKLYFTDSGILSHLLGITSIDALMHSTKKGDIVETFVHSELLKHIASSLTQPQLYHYRTHDKKEIDFILQKGDKIIAIEVKSAQTVKAEAFKHIIDFQLKSEETIIGIVLYTGDSVLSFGDAVHQRFAVPFSLFF